MSSAPESRDGEPFLPLDLMTAHNFLARGLAAWPPETDGPEARQFALRHAFFHRSRLNPEWALELVTDDLDFLREIVREGMLRQLAEDLQGLSGRLPGALSSLFRDHEARLSYYADDLPGLVTNGLLSGGMPAGDLPSGLEARLDRMRLRWHMRVSAPSGSSQQTFEANPIGALFVEGDDGEEILSWSRDATFRSGPRIFRLPDQELTCASWLGLWLRVFGGTHGPIALASVFPGSGVFQRWLIGHEGPVLGLISAPPTDQLWSFGADRAVRQWEVSTGRLIATRTGHSDRITGIGISKDESRLVSVSLDGTLRAWNLKDGGDPFIGVDNGGSLNGVAISPKGDVAYAASQDGSVRVWDLDEGTLLDTWRGHEAAVTGVALSANGRMLVSWSVDRLACLWTTESLELSKSLEHESEVTTARFLPNGQVLTADVDGRLWLWRLGSGKLVRRLFGHRGRIVTLDVNAIATRALTCGSDRTVRLWNLEDGQMLQHWGARLPGSRTLFGVETPENAPDFQSQSSESESPEELEPRSFIQLSGRKGRRIFAATGDSRPLRSKQVLEGDWHRMTRDGRYLLIVGHGVLTCHRIPSLLENTVPKGWRHKPRIPVVGCEVSPGPLSPIEIRPGERWDRLLSTHLISWDRENTISVHDAESGKVRVTLSGHDRPITAAVVDQAGRAITASGDGVCHVWDLEAGESRQVRIESSGDAVLGLILRDGEDTAVSWTRSSVARWSVSSGATLERHDLPSVPTRVRRPTQGSWIVAGTVGGELAWVGHPSRGQWVVSAHPDPVADVVISDNDEWIVTGSEGGDICLWDVLTGERIGVAWVDSPVRHLAVIGEHLAVEDSAGNVTLFEVRIYSRLKPGKQPG